MGQSLLLKMDVLRDEHSKLRESWSGKRNARVHAA